MDRTREENKDFIKNSKKPRKPRKEYFRTIELTSHTKNSEMNIADNKSKEVNITVSKKDNSEKSEMFKKFHPEEFKDGVLKAEYDALTAEKNTKREINNIKH